MAWQPEMLKPLFEQLIPTVETMTVAQVTSRAEKARLPGALVKEIEENAAWNEAARKALELAGPQVAAKWMNKTGISAENQPEVVLGTAVAAIVASHVLLLRRLDKLIAVANAPTVKPGQSQPAPPPPAPAPKPEVKP